MTYDKSLRRIRVVCAISVRKPAWNNSARLALRVGERRLRDLYRHAAQKGSARSNLRVWENVCAIIFKPLRHTSLRDQFGVCAGGLHDRLQVCAGGLRDQPWAPAQLSVSFTFLYL